MEKRCESIEKENWLTNVKYHHHEFLCHRTHLVYYFKYIDHTSTLTLTFCNDTGFSWFNVCAHICLERLTSSNYDFRSINVISKSKDTLVKTRERKEMEDRKQSKRKQNIPIL